MVLNPASIRGMLNRIEGKIEQTAKAGSAAKERKDHVRYEYWFGQCDRWFRLRKKLLSL